GGVGVVLGGAFGPDGQRWLAGFARAAAYDPATDTWRRIAPLPASRGGATAIWDGRELLVGGGAGAPEGGKPAPLSTIGFAYDPATNRWRLLPPMESGRFANAAAWTGKTLLLWGGAMSLSGTPTVPPHGIAYDPTHDR